jgi:hypothetical protein
MSFSSNYVFQNMSRIGLDNCYTQQRDIENSNYSTYMLQNYFANDCSMAKPIELATSQPAIVYSGGYGSGAGGCNIDQSSKLLIGTIQTHPKCKISLYERPFATVPYLGRGAVNPFTESQIQQGEQTMNKKSVSTLGQIQQSSYYPAILAEGTQSRMNNYFNSLENVPRSGVNSKDMYRDVAGSGPFGGRK